MTTTATETHRPRSGLLPRAHRSRRAIPRPPAKGIPSSSRPMWQLADESNAPWQRCRSIATARHCPQRRRDRAVFHPSSGLRPPANLAQQAPQSESPEHLAPSRCCSATAVAKRRRAQQEAVVPPVDRGCEFADGRRVDPFVPEARRRLAALVRHTPARVASSERTR